ncbi:MAG: hypothetical protein LBS50_03160 [Prevotellaceae bacterium]|jgi:hypothetical protein|nr:hypothetical protein [Prevotellaceae bacterium]
MKKSLMILIAVICFGLMLSCEKDELTGTTWKYSENFGDEFSIMVTFLTKSTFILTEDYDTTYGTYTYEKPNVIFESGGVTWVGTISGNIMIMEGIALMKQ